MVSIPKSYFMNKLWQKEPSGDCYVEFLPDIEPAVKELHENVISVSPHWFYKFMFMAGKSNETSIEFRTNGNTIFKDGSWRAAMELYNQSLRFAVTGSENISTAYANRSACFFRMEKYAECLRDIELARANGYPTQSMQKLNDREIACLAKLAEGLEIQEKTEPKLSFDPDANFPSMANVLEIRSNEEFGRHIVAKCDIDVGETVLVERPFFSAFEEHDRTLCSSCAQEIKNFIPCPNCTDAMFCDQKCMDANEIHKIACGNAYPRVANVRIQAPSIMAALNIFPTVEDLMNFVEKQLTSPKTELPNKCLDAQAEYAMFLKSNILPMETDDDRVTEVNMTFRCIMASVALKQLFNTTKKQRFLQHLIWQHTLILANALGRRVFEKGYGFGRIEVMGAVHSLFNHSCIPNLHCDFVENKLRCITTRPVKKGEQLFVMYNFVEWDLWDKTTQERQQYLLKMFDFECKCPRCVPMRMLTKDVVNMRADPTIRFISASNNSTIANEDVPILKEKCYEFLRKYGHLASSEGIAVVTKRLISCLQKDCPEYAIYY